MAERKVWNPEGNTGVVPTTKFHRKVLRKAFKGLLQGLSDNMAHYPFSYSAHPENGVVVVRASKEFLNKVYYHESDPAIDNMISSMMSASGRSRCRAGDTFDLRKGIIIATWKLLVKLVDHSSSIRKEMIKYRTRDLKNGLVLNAEVRTKMAAMLREKFGVENV